MHILKPIVAGLSALGIALSGWFGLVPESHIEDLQSKITVLEKDFYALSATQQEVQKEESVGAYNISGGTTYRLKASINSSASTINLASFKEPGSGIPYTMAYLATAVGYGTIDPQTDRSEFVSFSGITQNSNGSAALTGVERGLTRTPAGTACTASTTLSSGHPGQAIFILSDSPCHFAEYAVKRNDETVSGSWSFSEPTASANPATKNYVDTHVNGGTVSVDKITVAGTAGETFTVGQIIYLDSSTGKWLKANAAATSTSVIRLLGVAQGAGSNNVAVTNGILLRGLDSTNVNGVAGTPIWLSSATAGATSTSAGTFAVPLGVMKSTTQFYFSPTYLSPAVSTTTGTIVRSYISNQNPFVSDYSDGSVSITANTSLTRDMYYDSLSISNNAILTTSSCRIFARNVTIASGSTISANGASGSTGAEAVGGTGAAGGAGAATTTGCTLPAGTAGKTGGAGGNTSGAGSNGVAGTASTYNLNTSAGPTGGSGGNGSGGGSGGSGGGAGASTFVINPPRNLVGAYYQYSFSGSTTVAQHNVNSGAGSGAGGGGSSGGAGPGGGGSGAGGGVVWIAAENITNAGTISANGGNGGNGGFTTGSGGAGGGGGGGNGGAVYLIYSQFTNTGTLTASAGTGGSAGTTNGGSAGTAGGNGVAGIVVQIKN